MAKKDKKPIYRGTDKLVEVHAFIPKDCVVAGIIAQSRDGVRTNHSVHSVKHVFEQD